MKYSLFIVILLFASCTLNGLGPTDDSVMKEISSEPSNSLFIGKWKLDSLSYALIKEKYNYKNEQVELTLNADGSFALTNAPDFISDGFGEPVKGAFYDAKGTWKTTARNDHWELEMHFEPGDLYNVSMTTCYSLFERDSTIVITHSIGDGDSGDRFLYYKDEHKKSEPGTKP